MKPKLISGGTRIKPRCYSGFCHNTDSKVKCRVWENARGGMESSRDAKEGIRVFFRNGVRMRLGECLEKVSESQRISQLC